MALLTTHTIQPLFLSCREVIVTSALNALSQNDVHIDQSVLKELLDVDKVGIRCGVIQYLANTGCRDDSALLTPFLKNQSPQTIIETKSFHMRLVQLCSLTFMPFG